VLFNHDLTYVLLSTIAFIIAVSVHEANHAFVATALGDDTPRRFGRLSLNPMRHIDAMGILFFALAGIGWGATPVTPANLKPNPLAGNALVALAGPLSNLVLAILFSIPLRANLDLPPLAHQFLFVAAVLNLLLSVFNLIPIPPLDGFTILLGIVPRPLAWKLRGLERYGLGILLVLLVLPGLLGLRIPGCGEPLSCLFAPIARLFGVASLR
jgi:Zn-dependent protease